MDRFTILLPSAKSEAHHSAPFGYRLTTREQGIEFLEKAIELVDRNKYPKDKFPAGQWEYMKFYEESFSKATAQFEMVSVF